MYSHEPDKRSKDFVVQIEVLQEMINGLKAQLKAKYMDGYRQETKILSLQSQIDTLRVREKQLERELGVDNNVKYTPMPNRSHKLTAKVGGEYDTQSYTKTPMRHKADREPQTSKPLIKSGVKVQSKKKNNENEDEDDPLQRKLYAPHYEQSNMLHL